MKIGLFDIEIKPIDFILNTLDQAIQELIPDALKSSERDTVKLLIKIKYPDFATLSKNKYVIGDTIGLSVTSDTVNNINFRSILNAKQNAVHKVIGNVFDQWDYLFALIPATDQSVKFYFSQTRSLVKPVVGTRDTPNDLITGGTYTYTLDMSTYCSTPKPVDGITASNITVIDDNNDTDYYTTIKWKLSYDNSKHNIFDRVLWFDIYCRSSFLGSLAPMKIMYDTNKSAVSPAVEYSARYKIPADLKLYMRKQYEKSNKTTETFTFDVYTVKSGLLNSKKRTISVTVNYVRPINISDMWVCGGSRTADIKYRNDMTYTALNGSGNKIWDDSGDTYSELTIGWTTTKEPKKQTVKAFTYFSKLSAKADIFRVGTETDISKDVTKVGNKLEYKYSYPAYLNRAMFEGSGDIQAANDYDGTVSHNTTRYVVFRVTVTDENGARSTRDSQVIKIERRPIIRNYMIDDEETGGKKYYNYENGFNFNVYPAASGQDLDDVMLSWGIDRVTLAQWLGLDLDKDNKSFSELIDMYTKKFFENVLTTYERVRNIVSPVWFELYLVIKSDNYFEIVDTDNGKKLVLLTPIDTGYKNRKNRTGLIISTDGTHDPEYEYTVNVYDKDFLDWLLSADHQHKVNIDKDEFIFYENTSYSGKLINTIKESIIKCRTMHGLSTDIDFNSVTNWADAKKLFRRLVDEGYLTFRLQQYEYLPSVFLQKYPVHWECPVCGYEFVTAQMDTMNNLYVFDGKNPSKYYKTEQIEHAGGVVPASFNTIRASRKYFACPNGCGYVPNDYELDLIPKWMQLFFHIDIGIPYIVGTKKFDGYGVRSLFDLYDYNNRLDKILTGLFYSGKSSTENSFKLLYQLMAVIFSGEFEGDAIQTILKSSGTTGATDSINTSGISNFKELFAKTGSYIEEFRDYYKATCEKCGHELYLDVLVCDGQTIICPYCLHNNINAKISAVKDGDTETANRLTPKEILNASVSTVSDTDFINFYHKAGTLDLDIMAHYCPTGNITVMSPNTTADIPTKFIKEASSINNEKYTVKWKYDKAYGDLKGFTVCIGIGNSNVDWKSTVMSGNNGCNEFLSIPLDNSKNLRTDKFDLVINDTSTHTGTTDTGCTWSAKFKTDKTSVICTCVFNIDSSMVNYNQVGSSEIYDNTKNYYTYDSTTQTYNKYSGYYALPFGTVYSNNTTYYTSKTLDDGTVRYVTYSGYFKSTDLIPVPGKTYYTYDENTQQYVVADIEFVITHDLSPQDGKVYYIKSGNEYVVFIGDTFESESGIEYFEYEFDINITTYFERGFDEYFLTEDETYNSNKTYYTYNSNTHRYVVYNGYFQTHDTEYTSAHAPYFYIQDGEYVELEETEFEQGTVYYQYGFDSPYVQYYEQINPPYVYYRIGFESGITYYKVPESLKVSFEIRPFYKIDNQVLYGKSRTYLKHDASNWDGMYTDYGIVSYLSTYASVARISQIPFKPVPPEPAPPPVIDPVPPVPEIVSGVMDMIYPNPYSSNIYNVTPSIDEIMNIDDDSLYKGTYHWMGKKNPLMVTKLYFDTNLSSDYTITDIKLLCDDDEDDQSDNFNLVGKEASSSVSTYDYKYALLQKYDPNDVDLFDESVEYNKGDVAKDESDNVYKCLVDGKPINYESEEEILSSNNWSNQKSRILQLNTLEESEKGLFKLTADISYDSDKVYYEYDSVTGKYVKYERGHSAFNAQPLYELTDIISSLYFVHDDYDETGDLAYNPEHAPYYTYNPITEEYEEFMGDTFVDGTKYYELTTGNIYVRPFDNNAEFRALFYTNYPINENTYKDNAIRVSSDYEVIDVENLSYAGENDIVIKENVADNECYIINETDTGIKTLVKILGSRNVETDLLTSGGEQGTNWNLLSIVLNNSLEVKQIIYNYYLTEDTEVNDNVTYYEYNSGTQSYDVITPVGDENPSALGWYVLPRENCYVYGEWYVKTQDASVQAGKTYYTFNSSTQEYEVFNGEPYYIFPDNINYYEKEKALYAFGIEEHPVVGKTYFIMNKTYEYYSDIYDFEQNYIMEEFGYFYSFNWSHEISKFSGYFYFVTYDETCYNNKTYYYYDMDYVLTNDLTYNPDKVYYTYDSVNNKYDVFTGNSFVLGTDYFEYKFSYIEYSGYFETTDTEVDGNKTYYIYSGGTYSPVTPQGNEDPSALDWYEHGFDYSLYENYYERKLGFDTGKNYYEYQQTSDSVYKPDKVYYEYDSVNDVYSIYTGGSASFSSTLYELILTEDISYDSSKTYYQIDYAITFVEFDHENSNINIFEIFSAVNCLDRLMLMIDAGYNSYQAIPTPEELAGGFCGALFVDKNDVNINDYKLVCNTITYNVSDVNKFIDTVLSFSNLTSVEFSNVSNNINFSPSVSYTFYDDDYEFTVNATDETLFKLNENDYLINPSNSIKYLLINIYSAFTLDYDYDSNSFGIELSDPSSSIIIDLAEYVFLANRNNIYNLVPSGTVFDPNEEYYVYDETNNEYVLQIDISDFEPGVEYYTKPYNYDSELELILNHVYWIQTELGLTPLSSATEDTSPVDGKIYYYAEQDPLTAEWSFIRFNGDVFNPDIEYFEVYNVSLLFSHIFNNEENMGKIFSDALSLREIFNYELDNVYKISTRNTTTSERIIGLEHQAYVSHNSYKNAWTNIRVLIDDGDFAGFADNGSKLCNTLFIANNQFDLTGTNFAKNLRAINIDLGDSLFLSSLYNDKLYLYKNVNNDRFNLFYMQYYYMRTYDPAPVSGKTYYYYDFNTEEYEKFTDNIFESDVRYYELSVGEFNISNDYYVKHNNIVGKYNLQIVTVDVSELNENKAYFYINSDGEYKLYSVYYPTKDETPVEGKTYYTIYEGNYIESSEISSFYPGTIYYEKGFKNNLTYYEPVSMVLDNVSLINSDSNWNIYNRDISFGDYVPTLDIVPNEDKTYYYISGNEYVEFTGDEFAIGIIYYEKGTYNINEIVAPHYYYITNDSVPTQDTTYYYRDSGEYVEYSLYFLTDDTECESGKTYYEYDESTGNYVEVTPVGTENPSEENWYEYGFESDVKYYVFKNDLASVLYTCIANDKFYTEEELNNPNFWRLTTANYIRPDGNGFYNISIDGEYYLITKFNNGGTYVSSADYIDDIRARMIYQFKYKYIRNQYVTSDPASIFTSYYEDTDDNVIYRPELNLEFIDRRSINSVQDTTIYSDIDDVIKYCPKCHRLYRVNTVHTDVSSDYYYQFKFKTTAIEENNTEDHNFLNPVVYEKHDMINRDTIRPFDTYQDEYYNIDEEINESFDNKHCMECVSFYQDTANGLIGSDNKTFSVTISKRDANNYYILDIDSIRIITSDDYEYYYDINKGLFLSAKYFKTSDTVYNPAKIYYTYDSYSNQYDMFMGDSSEFNPETVSYYENDYVELTGGTIFSKIFTFKFHRNINSTVSVKVKYAYHDTPLDTITGSDVEGTIGTNDKGEYWAVRNAEIFNGFYDNHTPLYTIMGRNKEITVDNFEYLIDSIRETANDINQYIDPSIQYLDDMIYTVPSETVLPEQYDEIDNENYPAVTLQSDLDTIIGDGD